MCLKYKDTRQLKLYTHKKIYQNISKHKKGVIMIVMSDRINKDDLERERETVLIN
jgi:hypothetical protein